MEASDVKKLIYQAMEEKASTDKDASKMRQSATKLNGKPANAKTKPVHRFQVGNVTASVFYNEYTKGDITYPVYNVQIDRIYKNGDDWKSTNVFHVGDLHKVITVAQKAFEAIHSDKSE